MAYQDLVHQQEVPAGETFLQQIRNFEGGRNGKRNLDKVFENFIKNYSRYVLKDTFDLGIKKSYYAVHKKVEAALKERNIPPVKADDTTVKLIEAYKLEKNKLIASRGSERSIPTASVGKVRKVKSRPFQTEQSKHIDRMDTQ